MNNGKKVIVLEKSEMTGGNSVRATGGMNGTRHNFKETINLAKQAVLKKVLQKGWRIS